MCVAEDCHLIDRCQLVSRQQLKFIISSFHSHIGKKIFSLKQTEKYVCQGMTRKEICDFMQQDFSRYQWSIHTHRQALTLF